MRLEKRGGLGQQGREGSRGRQGEERKRAGGAKVLFSRGGAGREQKERRVGLEE